MTKQMESFTNMVNCLGIAIEVCSVLCDHFYRPTEDTPSHTMYAVGMACGDNIWSRLVDCAVNQEACGICWSTHISLRQSLSITR